MVPVEQDPEACDSMKRVSLGFSQLFSFVNRVRI